MLHVPGGSSCPHRATVKIVLAVGSEPAAVKAAVRLRAFAATTVADPACGVPLTSRGDRQGRSQQQIHQNESHRDRAQFLSPCRWSFQSRSRIDRSFTNTDGSRAQNVQSGTLRPRSQPPQGASGPLPEDRRKPECAPPHALHDPAPGSVKLPVEGPASGARPRFSLQGGIEWLTIELISRS